MNLIIIKLARKTVKQQIRFCSGKKITYEFENGDIRHSYSEIHQGAWRDNVEFDSPDENGDRTLEKSLIRECIKLNKQPPMNYWIEYRYIEI